MTRNMVDMYSPVFNCIPYIQPHIFAPDWLGVDSPFLSVLLCNAKTEPPEHSPTICADVQDTITGFLGYNHPHGSQFCPLATLPIALFTPGCFSGLTVCYHSPLAWVALAGPICVPDIFRDRIFSLLEQDSSLVEQPMFLLVHHYDISLGLGSSGVLLLMVMKTD